MTVATSSIAQQAFTELKLRAISSYADDSPEAMDAARRIIEARDMVLEAYDWSFARRLVTPPQQPDVTPPVDPDLPHVFTLPASTLALRHVFDASMHPLTRWRREGFDLRTAETGIRVLMTARETREDIIPATVRHVMALQLALLLAPTYAATRAKRADIADAMRQAMDRARQNDSVSAAHHRLDGLDVRTGDDWAARVVL